MTMGKGWIFLIALVLGIILSFFALKIPAVKNIGASYKYPPEARKVAIVIIVILFSLLIFYTSILLTIRHFSGPTTSATSKEEIKTDTEIPYTYNLTDSTWEKK